MALIKSCPVQPLSKQQLRQHFLNCDADGDGFLTREELRESFRKLGAVIPGYRTKEGLKRADANRDGRVSEEELDALIDFAYTLQYKTISN